MVFVTQLCVVVDELCLCTSTVNEMDKYLVKLATLLTCKYIVYLFDLIQDVEPEIIMAWYNIRVSFNR